MSKGRKLITFFLTLFCIATASAEPPGSKTSQEARVAFETFGLEPDASRAEATKTYWSFQREFNQATPEHRAKFEWRRRKIEWAWKTLEHHYDSKKPKAGPMPEYAPKQSLGMTDASVKNMIFPLDAAHRIFDVKPSASKAKVAEKYWKLLNELDQEAQATSDPVIKKAIEARRKNLVLTWDWVQYETNNTDKYPVPERPPPYITTRFEDAYKSSPYTIHNMPFEEYPYLLDRAFKQDGVDGVIKFLAPTEKLTPFKQFEQARAFEQALTLFVDQWNVAATNEQRLVLAQLIRNYTHPPKGDWDYPVGLVESVNEVIEQGAEWQRFFLATVAENTKSAEEYIQLVRQILPDLTGARHLVELKSLLADENGRLLYEKRFGLTFAEFIADYLDVPEPIVAERYKLHLAVLHRKAENNAATKLFTLIRNGRPVLGTLEATNGGDLSPERIEKINKSRLYLVQFYDQHFTEPRRLDRKISRDHLGLERPILHMVSVANNEASCKKPGKVKALFYSLFGRKR